MLYWDNENTIKQVISIMRSGGVIVGSSDTVIGLLAPISQEGFQALNTIKKRYEKPYLVLVKSHVEAMKLIDQDIPIQIENIMKSCWPGPLTLIFRARVDLPAYLKGPDGTIGIRVPDHEGLQRLLTHCAGLFSTSANKAGESVPVSIKEIDPDIIEHVTATVIDSTHELLQSVSPSTILDCSHGDIRVMREGAYSLAELFEKAKG